MFLINGKVSCLYFFAANVNGMKEKTRTVVSKNKKDSYMRVGTKQGIAYMYYSKVSRLFI